MRTPIEGMVHSMELNWVAAGSALLVLLILVIGIRFARQRSRSAARKTALFEAKSLKAQPPVPPPKIVTTRWFFLSDEGEAYGPFTREQLARLFELNLLNGSTLVLAEDGTKWSAMRDVFVLPVSRPSTSWRLGRWRLRKSRRDHSYYYSQPRHWQLYLQTNDESLASRVKAPLVGNGSSPSQ